MCVASSVYKADGGGEWSIDGECIYLRSLPRLGMHTCSCGDRPAQETEKPAMPKVSVVVPVHNAQRHIRECVDSILAQTLRDIEVILVDDGSTDASGAILADYALTDSRVSVILQSGLGAGAARNAGLDRACGEYLSFLDADDFFELQLLESAYERCIECDADVALFKARSFDEASEKMRTEDGFLRMDLVPDSATFSRADVPDHILNIVVPAAWNKMFKRSFVVRQKLRFQHLHRANDLFFTRMALATASRITVVDEYLVNYRVGVFDSLQATVDEAPLEFFEALRALHSGLVEAGVLSDIERSFVNDAVAVCLYNLHQVERLGSFRSVYEFLKGEGLRELGIAGQQRDYFHRDYYFEQLSRIMSMSSEEYLFDEARRKSGLVQDSLIEMDEMRQELAAGRTEVGALGEELGVVRMELDTVREESFALRARLFGAVRSAQEEVDLAQLDLTEAKAELLQTENRIKAVRASRSYQVGRRLTAVPRVVKRLMNGNSKGGAVRRA